MFAQFEARMNEVLGSPTESFPPREYAAIDSSQIMAYLHILYACVLVVFKDGQISAGLKRVIADNMAPAKSFEKTFNGADLCTALKNLQSGQASFTPDYFVEQAKLLRKDIREDLTTNVAQITHNALDITRNATTYLINQSQGALKGLQKLVPVLNNPVLSGEFIQEAGSQKEFSKPLQKIVQGVSGGKRTGLLLTKEEVDQLKQTPKGVAVLKDYKALRTGYNDVWQKVLRNMVFQSKQPFIDYQTAISNMKAQGLEFTLPVGFEGNIDSERRLYTKYGKLINGVPGPGFSVIMNPNYSKMDDTNVFTTKSAAGTGNHFYTVDYSKRASKAKFVKVGMLREVLDKARKKWLNLLKQDPLHPDGVCAVILELLYQTSARTGTVGNFAGGQSTFGMLTLQRKHLTLKPNAAILTYLGKDAVRHRHVITANNPITKLLYMHLVELGENKKPKDPLFTCVDNNKIIVIRKPKVEQLFHRCGVPSEISLHKLRHAKGSTIFEDLMDKNADKIFNTAKPLTQQQADAIFEKMTVAVGAALGHVRGVGGAEKVTGATAQANYIDPSLMFSFYQRLNLRPPKRLAKLVGEA